MPTCWEKALYMLKTISINVIHGFLLPWTTIKQLKNGESALRVYEVLYESFPQFVFQVFLLCFIGVDQDAWSIFLKVLALASSYLSVIIHYLLNQMCTTLINQQRSLMHIFNINLPNSLVAAGPTK